MSEFYAEVQGNRGIASRGGSKSSGIWGHIRSWNIGVNVDGNEPETNIKEFIISLTGGSNNTSYDIPTHIAKITLDESTNKIKIQFPEGLIIEGGKR